MRGKKNGALESNGWGLVRNYPLCSSSYPVPHPSVQSGHLFRKEEFGSELLTQTGVERTMLLLSTIRLLFYCHSSTQLQCKSFHGLAEQASHPSNPHTIPPHRLSLHPNKNKIPNVVFLLISLTLRKIYFVMKMEQENLTRTLCALHVSTFDI